jgi:O-methyltransferase
VRRGLRYFYYLAKSIVLYARYRDRSMVPPRRFVDNLAIVGTLLDLRSPNPAAVVECGTWQGGMAAALIDLCGRHRQYCFFDSFEGLPPAKEIDGAEALAWQATTSGTRYYDNCRSSIETFNDTIGRTGIDPKMVQVVEGFFEQSLPGFAPPEIAVLRLDGDWYESTLICLRKFWDFVLPGGVIIIDDYYDWDGCSRAVHDFLSERKATERINQSILGTVTYLVKNPTVEYLSVADRIGRIFVAIQNRNR